MIRIAMWSGPRNISTAMMRSWGNRPDTWVCDEPLYAHYLQQTGYDHPGAEEVMAVHETDWERVVAQLTQETRPDKDIFYQKHMAHHLLPHIELEWLTELANCFLIRDPREMLTSLIEFIPQPTVFDTGLPQQVVVFERMREWRATPIVLDARDVLDNPQGMLSRLCEEVGVRFHTSMLSWSPGLRETDGIWAKHWYDKVAGTTCFGRYRPKGDPVPKALEGVLAECETLYARLYQHRLQIDS